MESSVPVLLLCIGAFFLGAIPFGFLAGKMKGIDIREHGSKNIGATNIMRVLGMGPACAVFFLDAMKGCLPVLAIRLIVPNPADEFRVAVGMCAVLGHIYSPFVRFRGGKGVATSLGVLIALNWGIAVAAFAMFALSVLLTRYVSLGSVQGAIVQAALFWTLPHHGLALPLFGTLVAVFVILRHRGNIERLRAGTESRWGDRVKEAAPMPPPAIEEGAV